MKRKQIAIIGVKYWPSRGGVSRVVEDTIIQLKDEFDFTIYCYKHKDAKSNVEGVKVIEYPRIPLKGLGVFLFYAMSTIHAMIRGKYDIVHVHKTDAAFFLPILAKKFSCIATSHEAPYKRDKWTVLGKLYFRIMEKIFIGSEVKLTSISKPLADYYENTYGKEVYFIPNGVDTQTELDELKAEKKLAEYNIEGPFIFFAARRIMATKGCHTMLKALVKLGYQGQIVIAGDMTQLPTYTRQLKELAKPLNVFFIGYIDSKSTLLALVEKAQMFMFPSETEGMSIMLLEVASVGTPIVASDIPENTAVFDNEEITYFKNKNEFDLAKIVKWALENQETIQKKAHKAKTKIQNHYKREVVSQQYAMLYNSIKGSLQYKSY